MSEFSLFLDALYVYRTQWHGMVRFFSLSCWFWFGVVAKTFRLLIIDLCNELPIEQVVAEQDVLNNNKTSLWFEHLKDGRSWHSERYFEDETSHFSCWPLISYSFVSLNKGKMNRILTVSERHLKVLMIRKCVQID